MKRDLDLIRKIVLKIEEAPTGWAPQGLKIEGYEDDQIGYHSYLIVDAGLARGQDVTHFGSSGPTWIITNLTTAGHDFAQAARDQTRWKSVMDFVRSKGGDVTIA